MSNAFELAARNRLSVKTTSVTRDTKRSQIIIVEEVSQQVDPDQIRTSVYYYFADDTKTADINTLLMIAKEEAIVLFLGLNGAFEAISPDVKSEENSAEVAVEVEPEPEPVAAVAEAEPIKKKTRKRTSKKKAATLKVADEPIEVAPVVEVGVAVSEPEAVADDDDLDLGDDEETVLYNKTDKGHLAFIRPIIHDQYGPNWKEDESHKMKVRTLIRDLNGKVPVTNVKGEVLPTFKDACIKLLA